MKATLDRRRADAFARRMTTQLNEAMLALMTSIADQTGLFDAMAGLPPATSQEIAATAGLDERCVREWLAAMVTGRIVDYDGARGTYRLPEEHAACLTRAAGADNLARRARGVAALAEVEEAVTDAFRGAGGLAPQAFGRWRRLRAEEIAAAQDQLLLETILPAVPDLVERLAAGIDVVEIGCGVGRAALLMAARFPRSRFAGRDTSEESVAIARREAAAAGIVNATFDVTSSLLPTEQPHDLITAWGVLADQSDPALLLRSAHASLRSRGTFLCVEIAAASNLADNVDHPWGPTLYAQSVMYGLPVSRGGSGSSLGLVWGEERTRRLLAEAGFGDVLTIRFDDRIANDLFVARTT
jgi:SAM-dependent methyltransferase